MEAPERTGTRSRWVAITAFALVFSLACLLLARWQWHRLHEREAKNALVVANFDQPPVAVDRLASPGEPVAATDVWRQVSASGRYLVADQVLVRKRSFNEATGYWVMTPLRTVQGTVLWCVRGWIPAGADARTPSTVPPAPLGPVTVTGHLRAVEGPSDDAGLPAGQVQRIDTGSLSDRVDGPTYGAWLQVTSEDPAPSVEPTRLAAPEISDGPHLGYAVQWVIFAIAAWIGWWVVLRRLTDDDDEELG